jgi:hypothetical protein
VSTPTIFCVSCGNELPGTSRFCNSCGTTVPATTTSNQLIESLDDEYGEWFNATCVNCSNDVIATKKIMVTPFLFYLLFPPYAIIFLLHHRLKTPSDCPICWENVDVLAPNTSMYWWGVLPILIALLGFLVHRKSPRRAPTPVASDRAEINPSEKSTTRVSSENLCTNCCQSIQSDHNYCVGCGTKLAEK